MAGLQTHKYLQINRFVNYCGHSNAFLLNQYGFYEHQLAELRLTSSIAEKLCASVKVKSCLDGDLNISI